MHVMVVGAGIGGLTTALALHAEGISCSVYERADAVAELGVGLNLLPLAVARSLVSASSRGCAMPRSRPAS